MNATGFSTLPLRNRVLVFLALALCVQAGVFALHAAGQHGWSEARTPVMAIIMLACVAVIGSLVHAGTFNAANPSTWVWSGGLGLVAIGLAALAARPRLRSAAPARGG